MKNVPTMTIDMLLLYTNEAGRFLSMLLYFAILITFFLKILNHVISFFKAYTKGHSCFKY
uniref:Uncharacterized protein n=1 Tax=Octopus bimaculoides TaxID=37653 RepID=A0A0L8HEY2_OCTBM